jgi:NAD(P)-dependent dehydrogenase (short-subunit alcohol dehydrogenase family)
VRSTHRPGAAQSTAMARPLTLITGASRGIGAATALACAREGHDVVIHYLRDEQAARAVASRAAALGARVLLAQADVAVQAEVVRLFETIDREAGRLTGLVNNAGIVGAKARLDEVDAERLQRMFATNVYGSIWCAQQAVRRMSTRHGGAGGAIVNVSSVAARLGSPGEYVDYAASKGAIDTLTIGLAKEVAAEGVRVNGVRPGITDTGIHASGGQPDRAWRLAPLIPMQRPGRPEEVAQAIVWLLSEAASYTTGAIIDVGGGR